MAPRAAQHLVADRLQVAVTTARAAGVVVWVAPRAAQHLVADRLQVAVTTARAAGVVVWVAPRAAQYLVADHLQVAVTPRTTTCPSDAGRAGHSRWPVKVLTA